MRVLRFLLVLVIAGCATPADDLGTVRNSWLGASYEEVVARWGVPARSTQLSGGRAAHNWVSEGTLRQGSLWPSIGVGIGSGGFFGIGSGVTVAPGVQQVRCERTLFFQDGRVVDQTWIGSDEYCRQFAR